MLYTAGIGFTSWEIDLFGRIRSLNDAALAQFFASEESRRAVQVTLVSSVANLWLALALGHHPFHDRAATAFSVASPGRKVYFCWPPASACFVC